ncbi:hypothetical protein QBC43DRAFT_319825 [Cladorrhinum sp. PSN259]|nr:hypothetical protein QBC43DRAFT_319825 [Cladorrhinum sp. PSN259]
MEAIGAGASVVAFITLAVQSAKTVSDTLSGIQDAPENVRHATSAVGMLQAALDQLLQCPSVSQGHTSRDLHDNIKQCYEDLAGFASKLRKIQISGTASRSRQLWKRVRAFIDEKEIDRMVKIVTSHSSTLSLWLQSLQSAAIHDSKNQISALSRTISASAQDTQTRMTGELQAIGMKLEISRTESTDAHKDIDTKFSLILQAIESIKLATRTTDQDDETANSKSAQHPSSTPIEHPDDERSKEDAKVMKSVHRLQALVDQERRVLDMEEVDGIIEDLQSVIMAVQNKAKDSSGERLFKRISAVLGSAQMVSLNEVVPVANRPTGQIIEQKRFREESTIESGNLIITGKKRRIRKQHDSYDDEEFVGRMIFFPHKGARSMFTAIIKQNTTWTSSFTSIPHLQVNPILPNDSLVFQHIQEGRLDALVEMLRNGHASLRDHDERGNSLLAVAALHHQTRVCRFLLANNADVDICATDNDNRISPILSSVLTPNGKPHPISSSRESIVAGNELFRLLIDAGGDPTDESFGYHVAPFLSAFTYFAIDLDPKSMRLLLHSTKEYGLTINSRNMFGSSVLLVACGSCPEHELETTLAALLERGATVTDVDSWGRNCLHAILAREFKEADLQAAILINLIKSGAEVRAKDDSGFTVSHLLYDWNPRGDIRADYRRDLWDFVLTVCGYNALEVRGNFPRVARYDFGINWPEYTKKDFCHIWEGWEHLCPYPEDLRDEAVDIRPAATFPQQQTTGHGKYDPDAQTGNPRTRCNTHYRISRPYCIDCGEWLGCRDPNCDFPMCQEWKHSLLPVSGEESSDGYDQDKPSESGVISSQSVSHLDTQCAPVEPSSPHSSSEVDNEDGDNPWNVAQTERSDDGTHISLVMDLENPWADAV